MPSKPVAHLPRCSRIGPPLSWNNKLEELEKVQVPGSCEPHMPTNLPRKRRFQDRKASYEFFIRDAPRLNPVFPQEQFVATDSYDDS